MSPERKFVKRLEVIRDTWIKQGNTKAETADGIIYEILRMIDGDAAINDCHRLGIIDYEKGELVSGGNLLDIYNA